MNRKLFVSLVFVLCAVYGVFAQVPADVHVRILKAEDARWYNAELERLITGEAAEPVVVRAMLAAGRIGDERAIPALSQRLRSGSPAVAAMAAFALGEIESAAAADAVLRAIGETERASTPDGGGGAIYRGRLVEAAGKIAAANAKHDKAKDLGRAIVFTLEAELNKGERADRETILLGLTALLRARPEGTDATAAKFLTHADGRVRSDALNTMSRVRAKNANSAVRKMLYSDPDPNVRANAARVLGAAEDKEAFDLLADAAVNGDDLRVRVSAIRALVGLKNLEAGPKLVAAGRELLGKYKAAKRPGVVPDERGELLEIATSLGRLYEGKGDDAAINLISGLREADGYQSPETEAALARINPEGYLAAPPPTAVAYKDPWAASAYAQGLQAFGTTKDDDLRARAGMALTQFVAGMATRVRPADQARMLTAMPDLMRAMAALKPGNLEEIMRNMAGNDDVFVRAAAVEILAGLPASPGNTDAIKKAGTKGMILDKQHNDAQLAVLDALAKVAPKEAVSSALMSLNSHDYLVRRKAFEILKTADTKELPGLPTMVDAARNEGKDRVLPYMSYTASKQGQLLNTDADYRRAAGRRNGQVRAVLTTAKGSFTIDLLPEDAPLTVDNFVKLARSGYFNGLTVHRVVPNFVMQDGDNRGDGNGGPGWSIRCEMNMTAFERGSVGMALSGKDTGGSQWFAAHAPQPHLDGGYTVFGRVSEKDMAVVDRIVRGDKIISVRVVETGAAMRRPVRK